MSSKSKEGVVRKSISLRLIRHAESNNNQVYRDARHLFHGGTPDFDKDGWNTYVDKHRSADPGLSDKGAVQAQHLAKWLVPHLQNQSSHPVRVITSPMKRTIETILPTLEQLPPNSTHIIANAFYHESEGCHIRGKAEEGMNPQQIEDMLKHCFSHNTKDDDSNNKEHVKFEGFPEMDRGWYMEGTGPETRSEAEQRAAKFYLWLCDYLDHQIMLADSEEEEHQDVFDAGVSTPEEEHECDHDQLGPRQRKRRTCLLIGHGDFMGLVLKRVVTGFGHFIENENVPHRSAFVHFNTGMTELEYFGNGRFLIMNCNQTPHIHPTEYSALRGGGSLKDGWSFLVPHDDFISDTEVSVGFADELDTHVLEQTQALKELYLKSSSKSSNNNNNVTLTVGEVNCTGDENQNATKDAQGKADVAFVVRRGLEVVGYASYNEQSGHLKDVVVRPAARQSQVGEMLLDAVKQHDRKLGRSGSILVQPDSEESKEFLQSLGFEEQECSPWMSRL